MILQLIASTIAILEPLGKGPPERRRLLASESLTCFRAEESLMNLGIAFSGGGFRATLFHLGVVRYLRDEGRLDDVTHICAVSGGSVLAAHLVQNWDRYTGAPTEFEDAGREVIALVRRDVRGRILRRFITCLPTLVIREGTRFARIRVPATRLLDSYYHRGLYQKVVTNKRGDRIPHLSKDGMLSELSSGAIARPYCRILATNLNYGTIAAFAAEGYRYENVGSAVGTYAAASTRLSLAVASSSAYPALFAPVRISEENLRPKAGPLTDQPHLLTDGGVFDNLGVRQLRDWLATSPYYPPLRTKDILNPTGIMIGLLNLGPAAAPSPAARLANFLAPGELKHLRAAAGGGTASPADLVCLLNPLLHQTGLYDPASMAGATLGPLAAPLLAANPDKLTADELLLRNRLLLEEAFPGSIAACTAQGVTKIVSDAGRAFDRVTEIKFSDFILATAVRSSDVLMNRITEMERQATLNAGGFTFVDINDRVDPLADPTAPHPNIQRAVPQVRTDFDAFSVAEISGLVRHGYCVARKKLAQGVIVAPAALHQAPWDPVRPAGFDYTGADAADIKALEASMYRGRGIFSLRDWLSYVHVIAAVALATLLWYAAVGTVAVIGDLAFEARAGKLDRHAQINSFGVIDPYRVVPGQYEDVEKLEEPDYGGFDIQSDDRVFDLQSWRPSSHSIVIPNTSDEAYKRAVEDWRAQSPQARDKLLKDDVEYAFLTRRITLSKKRQAPAGAHSDEVRFQFSTSGTGVVPRLADENPVGHRWRVRRAKTLGRIGQDPVKRWELVVDLSDDTPDRPITLEIETLWWNGFQTADQWWAAVKLSGPTKEATVWVLFPDSKPFHTYTPQQLPVGGREGARVAGTMPQTNPRRTRLFWDLGDNPNENEIYKIIWTW